MFTVDETGAPQDSVFSRCHARGAAGAARLARRPPPVGAYSRAVGTVAGRRLLGLCRLARHRARASLLADLPGHADAPPWRRHWHSVPRREGRWRGVHGRRCRGAGAVRVRGRRRPSPTPARTAASSSRGPTSRPSSRTRRWRSWSSTRRPVVGAAVSSMRSVAAATAAVGARFAAASLGSASVLVLAAEAATLADRAAESRRVVPAGPDCRYYRDGRAWRC